MAEGRTIRESLSSHNLSITTIRNATRHKRQCAIHVAAIYPVGELSIFLHDTCQHVDTFSKQSTAESGSPFVGLKMNLPGNCACVALHVSI